MSKIRPRTGTSFYSRGRSGCKPIYDNIDDIFPSSMPADSFATVSRYESMGNTIVQLRGPLCSGWMVTALCRRVGCPHRLARVPARPGGVQGADRARFH